MNELLAQAYGTDQLIEDSLEKTAEAALLEELEKVASEEGIDLDELSDDDIIEILSEVMGAAEVGEEVKTASEDDEDGEEKLAEADFLGRTMAHAFYQEIGDIEKQASDEEYEEHEEYDVDPDDLDSIAVDRANELLAIATGEVEKTAADSPKLSRMKRLKAKMQALGARGKAGAQSGLGSLRDLPMNLRKATGRMPGYKKGQRPWTKQTAGKLSGKRGSIHWRRAGKGGALAAALAAALGGAGYGGYKLLSKKSSDENFEDVIDERALQLLDEAGYDVDAVIEAL